MTNKQKQNNKSTSEEKTNKEISTDVESQMNEDSRKINIDLASSMSTKPYPEYFKKLDNISAPWNPSINPLLSTINKTASWFDSMKPAALLPGIYGPAVFASTIPDYSKLGIMSSSMDFLSSLNNPIASFDIPKPINYANDKSYENLINFNYDNSSKINDLEKKLTKTNSKIKDLEFKNESLEIKTAEYEVLLKDKNSDEEELLLYKQRGHITSRISNIHLSNLIQSKDFFNEFEDLKSVDAVVISIDIRKSTELMLKAVSPQAFAKFITQLSKLLSTCVKLNYGVFDKFTGDGILAFFPKFLSGDHALLFALKTAMECHTIFEEHYKKHEFSFQVFNKSIGLGIGIECGEVAIVNNGVELTIVGTPVVYACRLGGAPSYTSLIGQKAMQTINEKFDRHVEVETDELNIKHEGVIGVYKLKKLKHLEKFLQVPDWSKYIKTTGNDNEAEENIKEEINNENPSDDNK